MKIILSMELKEEGINEIEELKGKITEEEIKEELKQQLFEVCEDWVVRGQEPDLDFVKD